MNRSIFENFISLLNPDFFKLPVVKNYMYYDVRIMGIRITKKKMKPLI